jgi:hypothetical protein
MLFVTTNVDRLADQPRHEHGGGFAASSGHFALPPRIPMTRCCVATRRRQCIGSELAHHDRRTHVHAGRPDAWCWCRTVRAASSMS